MRTPTGDVVNANRNGHHKGRLDEAALTRLASELFAALPGEPAVAEDLAAPGGLARGTAPAGGVAGLADPRSVAGPPTGRLPGDMPSPAGPATGALPGGGLAALAAEAIRAAEALASAPFLPMRPGAAEAVPPPPGRPAGVPSPTGARSRWDLRVPIALPSVHPSVPVLPVAGPGTAAAGPNAPSSSPAFYFIGRSPHTGVRAPLTVPGPAVPGLAVPGPAVPGPAVMETPSTPGLPGAPHAYDVDAIRRDFPILAEHVNGHPLVWLDNAATTQKPQEVIDRLTRFYCHENSNIHRGAHELATRATEAYEDARGSVAKFLGAPSPDDIVFVRGATEAINLVAQSWGRAHIHAGDEIVVSCLEHHANIVPWQLLTEERGAKLRVIPVDDSGQIILDEYRRLLTERTRLVAIAHVSNALGTIVPLPEVIGAAHAAGARVLIDGAQAVAHAPVDVQRLDPDFYVFSGHKVYGPTGIGALYGKADVLDTMPPWQGGGNMIRNVTFERTSYQPPPARFEAGTASIADAAGLATALGYVERIGRENIAGYEHGLLGYATRALTGVPGLHLVGTAPDKAGILSFVVDGYRPEDVGSALNDGGIAVRAGHHCAQPILRRFGLASTVRAALAMYNTRAEVDALASALHALTAARHR
jgi:cysteine desulfurase / selenocysteine lyase